MRPVFIKRGVVNPDVLDRPAYPINLAVGPGVEALAQAMLDAVPVAEPVKGWIRRPRCLAF